MSNHCSWWTQDIFTYATFLLYVARPPVVVFVSSKMGTLLLADAINKVAIELGKEKNDVHELFSFSPAATSLQLVSMATWPRRGGLLFCMASWRASITLWLVRVSWPEALTW